MNEINRTDNLPIYALENKPSHTTTGKKNFDQWWRDVPGVSILPDAKFNIFLCFLYFIPHYNLKFKDHC